MFKFIVFFISIFISNSLLAKQGEVGGGIDIGFGYVDIGAKDTAQTIANLAGSTVTYTYDSGAFAGRFYIDYGITDQLLIEAGYFQSGNIDAKYTLSGVTVTESYSVNGFDLSAVIKPSDQGIFFKGGFHSSDIQGNASIRISGTTYAAKATASGTGYLVGAGYDFSENYRIGYTYYSNIGGDSNADVGLAYIGWKF